MTAVDVDALDKLREALPEHQSWCHGEAHAECCGAGDCDCGVADSLDRLLPVVDRIATEREAAARRAQQLWDRKRVEDYAAVIGVELTPGDDVIAAVDEVHRVGAAAELRAAADGIPYSDSEVEAKQILRARADHLDPS